MAEVILREVSKIYPGGVKAVDRFTLDIRDGEFVVFVGPSGCGKSTTLRMIAGLEEITEGAIRIGDRVVNDVAPKDRDIAMVFQNYALYPHMSVYDNMAFSLKMRRRQLGLTRADIDRKVAETAEILGITDLLKRRPRELSGGQRQRVAVGRAIVRNPRAFLFDEPLSNLDAKLRGEMRAELKRLHRRLATTTIYVTHDQEEAMTLGDRVVVMRDGLIQQCGPPLEVYERPVNRFVGEFLGSPPMNFLAGHVRRGAGGLVFDEGSGVIGLPEPLARRVESRVGDALVLGVRPEAIRFNADGQREAARCECGERLHGRFCHVCGRDNGDWAAPDGAAMLTAKVLVVEPLGEDLDVVMTTVAKGRLVARVDARTNVREGQDVPVCIDMRGTHLFEPGDAGANVVLAADLEAGRVS